MGPYRIPVSKIIPSMEKFNPNMFENYCPTIITNIFVKRLQTALYK